MRKSTLNTRAWKVLAFLLVIQMKTVAAPILGQRSEVKQPDGTTVQVSLWGDEYYHWIESLDGYTLLKDEKGWISYASLSPNGDKLVSTGVVYRGLEFEKVKSSLPSLKKKIKLSQTAIDKIRQEKRTQLKGEDNAQLRLEASTFITQGEIKGLTILIDFPDNPAPASVTLNAAYAFFNERGFTGFSNQGSVRDFFYDVSNGKVDYTNAVVGYYHAPNPKSYYEASGKNRELFQAALEYADAQFDFSTLTLEDGRVKAVNFFYAGYANSGDLWPHQSAFDFQADGVSTHDYQVTNIGYELTIGTVCHENGHMLFHWPDLYDTDYSSSGLSDHCLMGSGNYAGGGKNPIPPNPYLKIKAGWETPTLLTPTSTGTFTATANSFVPYKYGDGQEYFLIEARTKTGRNADLPDEGLIVWHIGEDGANSNEQRTPESHYQVAIVQADGDYDLEGGRGSDAYDYFDANYKSSLNDFTNPTARYYGGAPSGLNISNISAIGATMSFDLGKEYDLTDLPGAVVRANNNDSPADEGIDKVADNNTNSKYLTFSNSDVLFFEVPGSQFKVNKYTITSANDAEERDPSHLVFYGSTDGQSWTPLDTASSVDFPDRFQKKEFSFPNKLSFAYYKLELQSDDPGNILQLAELEIFGQANKAPTVSIITPLEKSAYTVGSSIQIIANRGDLDGRVTKIEYYANGLLIGESTTAPFFFTWSNAPVGLYSLQAKATDNDGATSWSGKVQLSVNPVATAVDLTDQPGTLTAQYNDSPEGEEIGKLIDNQSGTKYLTFHPSGWVQFQTPALTKLSKYTITSANDYEERDPFSWVLKASHNETDWTTIDSRSGEDFPDRFQKKEYSLTTVVAYRYYRLEITNVSAGELQLAELELWGTPVLEDITNYGGTITAQYPTQGNENVGQVIDNSSLTKYFTDHAPIWVQFYQPIASTITSYTITSANDDEGRDPKNWTLKGSTDGVNWTPLDSRTDEDFETRFQKKWYSFSNTAAYTYYQLDIESNGGWTQFAELELIGTGGGVLDSTTSPSFAPGNVVLDLASGEKETGIRAWTTENGGQLHVVFQEGAASEAQQFSLYSLLGTKAQPNALYLEGNTTTLDVSHLPSGIYILAVQTNGKSYKKSVLLGKQ